MATNEFIVEDYLSIARTRTTEQFKIESAPIFDKYLQLLIDGFQDIEETYKQLMQLRSIDTAVGAQLDIIGNIVGQDRELLAVDLFDFFGMQGAINAFPMGDLSSPSVGGIFYSYGTDFGGNIELDDDTYRIFIKAKIFKNNTNSTPEDFISAVKIILNVDQVAIISDGDGQATVLFGRQLTTYERIIIQYISYSQGYPSRLLPKTVGVRINFGEFMQNKYFGFADSPGAKGFGDLRQAYGYGLGYGESYGKSDYTQDNLGNGGQFASIY